MPHNSLPSPTGKIELVGSSGAVGLLGNLYRGKLNGVSEYVSVKTLILDEITEAKLKEFPFKFPAVSPVFRNGLRVFGAYCEKSATGDPSSLWLVMERCPARSLFEVQGDLVEQRTYVDSLNSRSQSSSKRAVFPEFVIAYMVRETLRTLQSLHATDTALTFLSTHSVFLKKDGDLRFAHPSLLRPLLSVAVQQVCQYWIPPEMLSKYIDGGGRCVDGSVAGDVWALGVLGVELACGSSTVNLASSFSELQSVLSVDPRASFSLDGASISDAPWSPAFRNFISSCLMVNPAQRASVDDLLHFEFVESVREEDARKWLIDYINSSSTVDTGLPPAFIKQRSGDSLSSPSSPSTPIASPLVYIPPSPLTKAPVLVLEPSLPSTSSIQNMQRLAETSNLVSLSVLTSETILDALEERYRLGAIYTLVGDILIAVNPFRELDIYDSKHQQLYSLSAPACHVPHVYLVAQSAYKGVIYDRVSQCCLISGESGAGKTETAKYFMSHLLHMEGKASSSLENHIFIVNMILEAFGNAKTVHNDNSSRFGKYVEILYDHKMKVVGARLSKYLLEHSRVVSRGTGESSFHIFYYLLAGVSPADRLRYSLFNVKDFRYLTSSSLPTRVSTASNVRASSRPLSMVEFDEMANSYVLAYKEIMATFRRVGFAEEEIENVHKLLSAVLHLGNILFVSENDAVAIKNQSLCILIGELLGVGPGDLQSCLLTTNITAEKEVIVRKNTLQQCVDARDAVAKAIYGRLFSWIVEKINVLLDSKNINCQHEIGLLDIFGFENFSRNSFEQLCINTANEQLQHYFNQNIFSWELEEYESEGVDGQRVTFVDNKAQLDLLLGRPMGVLALIDEESRFPKASDQTLIAKLHTHLGKSEYYLKPKSSSSNSFYIVHFAGKIEYDSAGFLEKNRDTMSEGVIETLQVSTNPLVAILFCSPITPAGSLHIAANDAAESRNVFKEMNAKIASRLFGTKQSSGHKRSGRKEVKDKKKKNMGKSQSTTIGATFKASLNELMQKIHSCHPFFIRCLKPNSEQVSASFNPDIVLAQMNYAGVIETTRIRRSGFPVRLLFSEFLERYRVLAFEFTQHVKANGETCRYVLELAQLTDWQVGHTKVFLKFYHIEMLTAMLAKVHKRATILNSLVRRFLATLKLRVLKQNADRLRREEEEFRMKKEIEAQLRRAEELAIHGQVSRLAAEICIAHPQELTPKDLLFAQKKPPLPVRDFLESDDEDLDSQSFISEKSSIRVFPEGIYSSIRQACGDIDLDAFDQLPLNQMEKSSVLRGTDVLNRYFDILPNPKTIVRLRVGIEDEESDDDEDDDESYTIDEASVNNRMHYIHANFIHGFQNQPKQYIAAQGPMKRSAGHFWQMVWEQNVSAIVMLTHLVEAGKTKCYRYWPSVYYDPLTDKGQEEYGLTTVYLISAVNDPTENYVVSYLLIRQGREIRPVTHYFFIGWPDHGVPPQPDGVLALRHEVHHDHVASSDSILPPVLVHCSAGVGRTGTFIGIDICVTALLEGKKFDVLHIIRHMRDDRGSMVQSREQYELIHSALTQFALKSGIFASEASEKKRKSHKTKVQRRMSKKTDAQEGLHGMTQQFVDPSDDDDVPTTSSPSKVRFADVVYDDDDDSESLNNENDGALASKDQVIPNDESHTILNEGEPIKPIQNNSQTAINSKESRHLLDDQNDESKDEEQEEVVKVASLSPLPKNKEMHSSHPLPSSHPLHGAPTHKSGTPNMANQLHLISRNSVLVFTEVSEVVDQLSFLKNLLINNEISSDQFLERRTDLVALGKSLLDSELKDELITKMGYEKKHASLLRAGEVDRALLVSLPYRDRAESGQLRDLEFDVVEETSDVVSPVGSPSPPRRAPPSQGSKTSHRSSRPVSIIDPTLSSKESHDDTPNTEGHFWLPFSLTWVNNSPDWKHEIPLRCDPTNSDKKIWATVSYYEGGMLLKKWDLSESEVSVSAHHVDSTPANLSIGLVANPKRDPAIVSCRRAFADGIVLQQQSNGDVWALSRCLRHIVVGQGNPSLEPAEHVCLFQTDELRQKLDAILAQGSDQALLQKALQLVTVDLQISSEAQPKTKPKGKKAPPPLCQFSIRYEAAAIEILRAFLEAKKRAPFLSTSESNPSPLPAPILPHHPRGPSSSSFPPQPSESNLKPKKSFRHKMRERTASLSDLIGPVARRVSGFFHLGGSPSSNNVSSPPSSEPKKKP